MRNMIVFCSSKLLVATLAMASFGHPLSSQQVGDASPLFLIGDPDGHAAEFGLVREGYSAFNSSFPDPVVFQMGQDSARDWPFVHPSHRDTWAGGRAHPFTIRFSSAARQERPLYLLIGIVGAHSTEHSKVTVAVNGVALPVQTAPGGVMHPVFDPHQRGRPDTMVFPVPAGMIIKGENAISIRLDEQSWILYDYVALTQDREPLKIHPRAQPNLIGSLLANTVEKRSRVVFAVRQPGRDEHWYANFSYYAPDEKSTTYGDGGRLCLLDLESGELQVLLDDPKGGIRDPKVHYDARKILFSYRPGGSTHYHLYEIGVDGEGLTQLTDGDYDDIEPTYLPDGGIVFVSSRCKRWVNCWLTQVATLHRCDADGNGIRALSGNLEHDNTPWVLPDGRILYQRWEYVDRSQVHYHHLWTTNPDGTGQMVYYGNQTPGVVMIDAKPVPDTNSIVATFSPGHGRTEHDGSIAIVNPAAGPDDPGAVEMLHGGHGLRDPFPFSADMFLVAQGSQLVLLNRDGETQTIFSLSDQDVEAGLQCHEPRALRRSPREFVAAPRSDLTQDTGQLILADVCEGRNMAGVERGEIKKLLVIESLPKPINFTGGMEPLSYGGTFTLERVLGTVPVEPDGSAFMELPALRSLFFVALDENDMSVKRMQSFLTVQPGEVTGCVGCHEQRTKTPTTRYDLTALRHPPSKIQAIEGVPEVFDFPRDVQPILDRHCLSCHGYEETPLGGPLAGSMNLSGARGPMYSHSYFSLTVRRQFSDGRNLPKSNYPPRTLGSSASPLLGKLDPSHYGVEVTDHERDLIRLWIEVGAPYPGTYAALGTGMIGGYERNQIQRADLGWPATQAGREIVGRRCSGCHSGHLVLPNSPSDNRNMPPWDIRYGDIRLRLSRHILYNLTEPAESLLLLAPLAKEAGGFGLCKEDFSNPQSAPAEVFASTVDADYLGLLAAVRAAANHLDQIKRFDMPGFRPRDAYLREMQRYGILPDDLGPEEAVDPYATDRAYWRSLWYRPSDQ